ncbi:hypothetical protein KY285_013251 [Solanum tuberosum]|nr:hypothetical protein KY285_013251 [Solanum tuberosum]
MASLFKDLAKISAYRDRRFPGTQEEFEDALLRSITVYVGNMSFYTTEEQVYELFSRAGEIKKIVMGLDKNSKTPCGFCFIMYYSRDDAEDSVKYISGTILDDRPIRVDFDWGFQEGRQWGRGRSGGQKDVKPRLSFNTLTSNTSRWLWKIGPKGIGSTKAASGLWDRIVGRVPTSYASTSLTAALTSSTVSQESLKNSAGKPLPGPIQASYVQRCDYHRGWGGSIDRQSWELHPEGHHSHRLLPHLKIRKPIPIGEESTGPPAEYVSSLAAVATSSSTAVGFATHAAVFVGACRIAFVHLFPCLSLTDTRNDADGRHNGGNHGRGGSYRHGRDYHRKRHREDDHPRPDYPKRTYDRESRRNSDHESRPEKNPRFRESGDSDEEDDDDRKRRT